MVVSAAPGHIQEPKSMAKFVHGNRIRRFILFREEDVNDFSGTGAVVEGCQFSDGSCAYRWLSEYSTNTWAPNIETIRAVHGHDGKTVVVWRDE